MFTSLKNKIREETGSDVSKITAKISAVQKPENGKDRVVSAGSMLSLNSVQSAECCSCGRQDEKDQKIATLEREKAQLNKIVDELRKTLVNEELARSRLSGYQDDEEHIQTLQAQELAKVKYLVLLREQELEEKSGSLKETVQQAEKLRTEVTRLRRQEEHLSNVLDELESLRHSSSRELATKATELARSEEERRHLSDLVAVLRQRTENPGVGDEHFSQERKLLEQRLEEAHFHLADIKTSWSDKISCLETQVGRLSRQAAEEGAERRRADEEKQSLAERGRQMENEIECLHLEMNNKDTKIMRLELEIQELLGEIRNVRSESEGELVLLRRRTESSTEEIEHLRKSLEKSTMEISRVQMDCIKMQQKLDAEAENNHELADRIVVLKTELEEEKGLTRHLQETLMREVNEKNSALMRNAEVSQSMEIAKKELREQEKETMELLRKMGEMEKALKRASRGADSEDMLSQLEEQLVEKNKSIRLLQQKITEMKKQETTWQKQETKLHKPEGQLFKPEVVQGRNNAHFNSFNAIEEDINFKYLKHVLIKFLTSREYEAQHLTRAVATLLKFSPEEERFLQETLEWKMSWFRSRPNLGYGQTAKTIPPS